MEWKTQMMTLTLLAAGMSAEARWVLLQAFEATRR